MPVSSGAFHLYIFQKNGEPQTGSQTEAQVKPRTAHLPCGSDSGIFPFHYENEAEQYTFYRIPKPLFDDPYFRELSTDAKVLYGLMLDRMSLSLKNGWLDDDGRVFIYFTAETVMEMLGCANGKCARLLQELDTQNGIGLITRIKQGLGKPDVIYVHKCIPEMRKSNVQRCENRISGSAKIAPADMRKSHTNNTNLNNTDFIYNNPIFSEGADATRRMAERESYRQMVLENIDYDTLIQEPKLDRSQLDEIVDLMVDTICSSQEYIVIGGDRKPASVVKSQFCKLDSSHIQFVMDSMHENTSRVRNIRKYLLSVLYNASMTIDSYYSARVNHDLYGR